MENVYNFLGIPNLEAHLKSDNAFLALKIEVLTHYGDGKLACKACGYKDIRALSLDHMNNDGFLHKHDRGASLYTRLKQAGYPKDEAFQTLCMNCQFLKRNFALANKKRETFLNSEEGQKENNRFNGYSRKRPKRPYNKSTKRRADEFRKLAGWDQDK